MGRPLNQDEPNTAPLGTETNMLDTKTQALTYMFQYHFEIFIVAEYISHIKYYLPHTPKFNMEHRETQKLRPINPPYNKTMSSTN